MRRLYLVWAFFVIVKTDGSFSALSSMAVYICPLFTVWSLLLYILVTLVTFITAVCCRLARRRWTAPQWGVNAAPAAARHTGKQPGAAGTFVTYQIFNFSNFASNLFRYLDLDMII